MSKDSDIDRFVKEPSLFVELCREVVDRLDAGSHDVEKWIREAGRVRYLQGAYLASLALCAGSFVERKIREDNVRKN